MRRLGLLLAGMFALAGEARAQNPAWTATLMVQPFPSPFLADWQRNPQMAVLTVLYTGRGSQSFRVEAYARATAGEVGRVISPPESFAFGPTTQLFTTTDLLTWNTERSNGRYVYTVQRTGRLPEGPLQLCARVLDQNGAQLTVVCTNVTIALPDAPQLIFPAAAGVAQGAQPVFQWTPVVVPPEIGVTYRVHIVERGAQQTPATALAANPAIFDQTVAGTPMLTYPVNALPLETGKEYVWQVEALDQNGFPITRGQGKSEIRTFTVGGPGRPPASLASFPDTLTLVPGLARLSGLSKAQVTETPFAYQLDGSATLQLTGAYRGQVRVQLDGLTLDKRSVTNPVFTAGSLSGTLPAGVIPTSATGAYVQPTTITYDAHAGFSVAARLALGGASVPFTGTLQLTAAGLAGRLTAGDAAGPPIATLGADPAQLLIRQAAIALPGGSLSLTGSLSVFGQDPGCAVGSAAVDGNGTVSASIACRPPNPVALVPGDTRLQLALSAVSGSFSSSLSAKTSSYQLSASGQVALDAGGATCGGSLTLTIAGGAVTPGAFTPSCDGSGTGADLGWLTASLSGLRLQRFAYTPGKGFDFAFQVDLTPALTAAAGVQLPQAPGVTADANGLTIPASQVTGTRGPAGIAGFGFRVTRASLSAFTLSWKDWQAHSAAGFTFSLDGSLAYTGLPQDEPACLAGVPMGVTSARLAGGTLTLPVADHTFNPACQVNLGGGAAVALEKIGGSVVIQLAPQAAVTQVPAVTGALILPPFFTCAASGDQRIELTGSLGLSPAGLVTGQVSGLAPKCPITLAALQLNVTGATLTLAAGTGGAQSAVLSGTATGKFTAGTSTVNGSGTIGIDLVRGRLASGSLAFQGPFELDLPTAPALLAFTVGAASLDTAGLHVDGRAQLLLPNKQTLGATFDQIVVNPRTAAVTAGKVLFDGPWGLEIGTGTGAALTWKTLGAGAALDVSSGMRIDLPAQTALTPAGLVVSGTASGHLVYGGKDLDSISAAFSPDFALALVPAGVAAGSVALGWHGAQVGSVDAQGFHPNLGALATGVLPAQLGLPTTDVAYLQLKDAQGNLLVTAQNTSAGVHLTTAPNATVALVFPALTLGRGTAPQLNVSLDVTLDPLGRGITSGTIKATVPAGASGFDLSPAGLPFAIDSITYAAGGGAAPSFALSGALALFGQRQAGAVTLQLDATGHLTGAVDVALTPADSIPLVPGFGGLSLIVSHVAGSFGAALTGGGPLQYDVSATSALVVGTGTTGRYRASAVVDASSAGVKVTQLTLPAGADSLGFVDLGAVRLGLSGLQVPALTYDPAGLKWHFDLLFDAALQFPQLDSLMLPGVPGVELTETGFTIPQINLPQLTVPAVTVAGFTVQPQAFRTKGPIAVNWFTGQGPTDWGFAFDLSLGFGSAAPAALRGVTLSVLGAGLTNGVFTGQIEPPPLSRPIAVPGGSIDAFGGSLGAATQGSGASARTVQGVGVTAAGHYVYPSILRCAAAPGDTSVAVSAGVTATGRWSGTVSNVAPSCPVQIGPLMVKMTGSSLTLADSGGAQTAILAGTAALKLAAPTVPDSVTASGSLSVDLAQGRVNGGVLLLTQPFRWSLPAASPLLAFDVSAGRIDSAGFALTGSAALMVAPGDSIVATVKNLLLALPDLSVKRGSLTLTNGFAVQAALDASLGLSWQVVPRTATPPASGALIAAPDTVTLDSTGFHLGGSATASLAFAGKSYLPSQLAVRFDSGFALGVSPVGVRRGRATLISGTDTIAVVNQAGFLPGDVFGVLPIPDSIPLPAWGVAYVRLRDAQHNLLVTTSTGPNGTVLATKSPVPLVVPALAGNGGAPSVTVSFAAAVNTTTWQLASATDSIAVSSAAGAPLFAVPGLGLDVERLAFKQKNGSWTLVADAKLHLPASVSGADIRFKDLTVSAQGFSGTATVGTYSTTAPADPQPVATVAVSQSPGVSVQFNGATVTFGGAFSAKLSGQVVAASFTPTPIFFTGQLSSQSGVALSVDASSLPPVAIGQASFTASQVAVGVFDTAFTVTLGGTLALPALTPDFAVSITGLKIGSHGVQFPPSVTVNGSQTVALFGAQLALQNEQVNGQSCPALGVAYASPVVTLTLSGQITFLGNTANFCKLSVGSDGSVSIVQGSLLSAPITIAPNVLTLDTLMIVSQQGTPALRAAFSATLPAPVSSTQHGSVTISKSGVASGALDLALLTPAKTQAFTFGQVSGALSAVNVHLNIGTPAPGAAPSEVEAVAELCFKSGACPRQSGTGHELDLGSVTGNSILPGIVVGFDGKVQIRNLTLATPDTLGYGPVELGIATAAAPGDGTFGVDLAGGLSIAVSAVTSEVQFKNVSLTSQGLQFGANWLTGGSLTIADVFSITISNLAFANHDTTIAVPLGSSSSGSSSTNVSVSSFVRASGGVSLAGVFTGGVRQVLVYQGTDGSTHVLVDSAGASVPALGSIFATLSYTDAPNGFDILVGGSVTIGTVGVAVVGDVGKMGSTEHIGLFVAVKGLTIPVPGMPVIQIAGLGGGFFLNPTQADVDAVHQACGVAEADLTHLQVVSSPTFAVFLYGEAQIVSTELVDGQVLLTVENDELALDGNVKIIKAINNQYVKVEGDIDLVIGFAPAFADGSISITALAPGMLNATAKVEFYVVDANTWGIAGVIPTATLMDELAINDGQLFVGPAGFFLGGDISGTYSFTLFSVTGDFSAKLWYFTQTKDWGAYVSLGVEVSVLDGALTAKGTIAGALVSAPPASPLIYISGELTASALGESWTGTVWAQFQGGKLSAGFGDDPAMDQAIADAEAQAQAMVQAGASTQAALTAARQQASQVVISSSALAAAFQAIAGMNAWQYIGTLGLLQDGYEKPNLPTLAAYFPRYDSLLQQEGGPTDSTRIRILHDSLTSELTALGGEIGTVTAALQRLTVQTTQLSQTPLPKVPAAPPVTASMTKPVLPQHGTGATTVTVTNAPSFSVDPAAKQQWVSVLTQRQAAAQAYEQQVRQELQQLETGLAVVHAATGADTGTAFLAFVQRYDGAARMAQEQAARMVNATLSRRDWARAQDGWLETQASVVSNAIYAEPPALTQNDQSTAGRVTLHKVTSLRMQALCTLLGWSSPTCTKWSADSMSAINNLPPIAASDTAGMGGFANMCHNMGTAGAGLCPAYRQDSTLVANHVFHAADSIYAKWADTAGMALWYRVADAGLQAIASSADSLYSAAVTAFGQQLAPIQSADLSVSTALNGLSQSQAGLTGRLHDVYARYLFWKTGPARTAAPAGGTSGTLTLATPATKLVAVSPVPNLDDTAAVRARISALEQDLTVPTVTGVQMSTFVTTPYMAGLQFTWTGQHADGITEYVFNDAATPGGSLTPAYYSAGGAGSRTLYLFTASSTGTNTVSRTFDVGVRGGAGYVGYGRSNYSVTFDVPASGPCHAGGGCGSSQATGGGLVADATPPSTPVVTFPNNPLVVGSDGVARIWSSDPASIEAAWSAVDNESGISEYDYELAGGVTSPAWIPVGGRTDLTLDQLKLSSATPSYVLVRAKNGQGLTSGAGASAAIYYDSTGPAWPTGAALAPPPTVGAPGAGSGVSVIPITATYSACTVTPPPFPVVSAPAGSGTTAVSGGGTSVGAVLGSAGSSWSGSLSGSSTGSTMSAGAAQPQIVLSFPAATDPQSGLQDYFWHADQTPDSTLDPHQWVNLYPSQTSFTVGGSPLDYQHQFYVSVIARNHAGGASRPLVYGPFQVADPSPPTAPSYCGGTGASPGYLVAQLTTPAADPETGVKGYEYRVRDAAGGTVRAFPTGNGAVDWAPQPANTVLSTGTLSLVGGHSYYLDVRAVNWDNMPGPAATSGPIGYDVTPPPAPGVTATYSAPQVTLTVQTQNDPESGLLGLQVAVGTTPTGSDVIGWENISKIIVGQSTQVLTAPGTLLGQYYVQVREIDRAGIPGPIATATFTVSPTLPNRTLPAGKMP